jgi:hypothetical protein
MSLPREVWFDELGTGPFRQTRYRREYNIWRNSEPDVLKIVLATPNSSLSTGRKGETRRQAVSHWSSSCLSVINGASCMKMSFSSLCMALSSADMP